MEDTLTFQYVVSKRRCRSESGCLPSFRVTIGVLGDPTMPPLAEYHGEGFSPEAAEKAAVEAALGDLVPAVRPRQR